MARRRCIDDHEIVEGTPGGFALLLEVPDLAENDQFSPTRYGLEQLLKGFRPENPFRQLGANGEAPRIAPK